MWFGRISLYFNLVDTVQLSTFDTLSWHATIKILNSPIRPPAHSFVWHDSQSRIRCQPVADGSSTLYQIYFGRVPICMLSVKRLNSIRCEAALATSSLAWPMFQNGFFIALRVFFSVLFRFLSFVWLLFKYWPSEEWMKVIFWQAEPGVAYGWVSVDLFQGYLIPVADTERQLQIWSHYVVRWWWWIKCRVNWVRESDGNVDNKCS